MRRFFTKVECVKYLSILCSIILMIAIGNIYGANAASKSADDKSEAHLQIVKETRLALNEERNLLEKQADRHFSHLDSFINRVIWGISILILFAFGLLVWFFGHTRNEMKATLHELFEKDAKTLIEKEADLLQQKYQSLKNQVDDLVAYQESTITWVFSGDTIGNQKELEALHSMGLQRIQMIAPDLNSPVDIGTPDLVIFTYDGTQEGKRRLKLIVDKLKNETPPVFLIIYTYNPNRDEIRINTADISEYDWYVPANFPSQLIFQAQLLARRKRSFLKES